MLEIQNKIYNAFNSNDLKFSEDYLIIPRDDRALTLLDSEGIQYEVMGYNDTIQIKRTNFPFRIYKDISEYLLIDEIEHENVLIWNWNSNPLSFIQGSTYLNFIVDSDNYFFLNARAYGDLLFLFKTKDKESEDSFRFIDYHNLTTKSFIFISLSDKARLVLKYSKSIKEFDHTKNLFLDVEKLNLCFKEDNYHLPKFLKNALIDYCSRFEESSRINMLFENLNHVIDKAKINFEIYINGLSIDKIKKEYDDYKVKYFKEVSDILSNLTTKVVSFPVLTASTLFAVEKLKDYPFFIGLLIITTLIINIYLVILLVVNFKDLNYISSTVENDYNALIENNFFIKFPKEKSVFLRIKQRIISRIQYLRYMCEAYYWIMGVSNGAIIYLMLTYLKLSKPILCIYSLAAFLVLAIARNKILENAEKDIL